MQRYWLVMISLRNVSTHLIILVQTRFSALSVSHMQKSSRNNSAKATVFALVWKLLNWARLADKVGGTLSQTWTEFQARNKLQIQMTVICF